MVRSLRNRFFLLALAAGLTFLSGLVFAQALPVPVNISPVSASPAGLQSVVTFDARGVGGAANAGYYSRPVLISNNTLGGLANGLARRAVPVAAFTAAVAAGGWVIDELTKQVQTPGSPQEMIPAGTNALYWVHPDRGGGYYAATGTLHPAVLGHHNATAGSEYQATHIEGMVHPYTGGWLMYARPWASSYVANFVTLPEPYPDAGTGLAPVPLTSPELAGLIKDNPQLWNDALRNPDGSVNRNPDVQGEAQRLADELLDPEASPQPDPTAEWDTGQQGGDPQHSPTALEFPVFCTWASKVCELADWLMADDDEEPPANEIDWIDPEAAVTWSSGLGGGSCPADVSASLPFGGEVTFPMGQFCEAADMIRPLVLVSAALIAAMIIGGYRRAS